MRITIPLVTLLFLLCLPEVQSHQNGALVWQIDKTHLPEVGTKVTLRLRRARVDGSGRF